MRRHIRSTVVMFAIALVAAVPGRAIAQNFRLDPDHSFIAFEIKHLDLANAWGLAVGPTGSFTLDAADPARSTFKVQVQISSIITGNGGRDTHIKGPDFFDAAQFPTISFESKSVKKAGDNYEVTGDFTLHGVTKPLTVTMVKTGERDTGSRTGYRAGFQTTFTIDRTQFGITGMQGNLGNEVTLHVSLEGQRQ